MPSPARPSPHPRHHLRGSSAPCSHRGRFSWSWCPCSASLSPPVRCSSGARRSSRRPPPAAGRAAAQGRRAAPGFLYGRVTTQGGDVYEGRLRWGGDEEAFWGDTFNGTKDGNRWAAELPPERLPTEVRRFEVFGVELFRRERAADLRRPFMARFGDIARIEAGGTRVRVTLKSGTAFDLDRLEASDFDDGVRVWDARRGVVDLASGIGDRGARRVRSIELLPTPPLAAAPRRLYGTVHTRAGDFTGFVQWDRQECVGSDTLDGRAAEGPVGLRFDAVRSIARRADGGSLVTLADGREVALSGSREVGRGNRGAYVDDRRYGRVLVPWDAFERLDLRLADGSGPAYGDFPPGRPLTGSVVTRRGRRLAGRLVWDLDESETTETLDAPAGGVDFIVPFGRIASILLPGRGESGARRVRVTLRGGEELALERAGDLGDDNVGLLVFVAGRPRPEVVLWPDVARVELDRPREMPPPAGH